MNKMFHTALVCVQQSVIHSTRLLPVCIYVMLS